MGIVKKDTLRTTLISYVGLVLGYLNKAFLFIILLTTQEIGIINLLITSGLFFAQLSNLGSVYVTWRFFPFFRDAQKKNYGFLFLNFLIVMCGSLLFTLLFYLLKAPIHAYFMEKSPLFVTQGHRGRYPLLRKLTTSLMWITLPKLCLAKRK